MVNEINIGIGTNHQTKSLIDNFKDRKHKLTKQDSRKGGMMKTEAKRKANAIKNLKTGKYSKTIKLNKCNICGHKDVCRWFQEGAMCRMEVQAVKDVMKIYGGGAEELFKEINKNLQHMKVALLRDPTPKNIKEFVELLFEYKRARFGDKFISLNMDLGTYLSAVIERYEKEHGKP